MLTVECPVCGAENEFEEGNDSIVCEGCGAILNIEENGDGHIATEV